MSDTAIVGFNYGEFGVYYQTIADELLQSFEWKSTKDKNRMIDEVITQHNYLHSAYTILEKIQPNEKYYSYIRDMAARNRKYEEEIGERDFNDIEYALYGLAAFKKSEDIPLIKKRLMKNIWQMGEVSFRLMKQFPDTTYLDVFEEYYPKHFYYSICRGRNIDVAISFINSLATYQNERSAKILDAILKAQPINCAVAKNYFREELEDAIWSNSCKAYLKLRSQLKGNFQINEKKSAIKDSPVHVDSTSDPLPKDIRFW